MTVGVPRPSGGSTVGEVIAICLVSSLLGSVALVAQVRALGLSQFGYFDTPSALHYIENGNQWTRHQSVLAGEAPSPWQYRVFSVWVNQWAIDSCSALGANRPVAAGFLSVRWLQNFAILGLAASLYRRLGLSLPTTLLGVSILAAAMGQAVFDSDLSTNTYFDVVFYLVAAVLVLHGRLVWVIPVVAMAALNRETSILIPLLMVAGEWRRRPVPPVSRYTLALSAVAVTLFVAEFFGLRAFYGARPLFEPYGVSPGLDLVFANVLNWQSWFQLILSFGIVPVLSLFGLRSAPTVLRNIWVLIVPGWIGVHLALAVIAETRLFLVPMALAFVPCALFLVTTSVGRGFKTREP